MLLFFFLIHWEVKFEFACYSFFLIHWEVKRHIRSRDSHENHTRILSLCPFSEQNGVEPVPFGAAHTYKANIREYSPPPPPPRLSYEIFVLVLSKVLNHLPIRHILCRTTGILASWGCPAKSKKKELRLPLSLRTVHAYE